MIICNIFNYHYFNIVIILEDRGNNALSLFLHQTNFIFHQFHFLAIDFDPVIDGLVPDPFLTPKLP